MRTSTKHILIIIGALIFGCFVQTARAQTNPSISYVPLIGITSVPDPLALPHGSGDVTYRYAVKNFLQEAPLINVRVTDDTCNQVKFIEGDDNSDGKLDYSETWRYTCTTRLSTTTQSIATATGSANGLTASHRAYAAVVVGSDSPYPLVSIINITKVAYPLSLPPEGGPITFTYRVNNPGAVPLTDVSVVDDKCSAMSGKLGDTNGNNFLDIHEVWIYTCTTILKQTTTNTVNVTAYANGLKAVDSYSLTVKVADSGIIPGLPGQAIPSLPETGVGPDAKTIVWGILAGILAVLVISLVVIRKNKWSKSQNRSGLPNKAKKE